MCKNIIILAVIMTPHYVIRVQNKDGYIDVVYAAYFWLLVRNTILAWLFTTHNTFSHTLARIYLLYIQTIQADSDF